MAPHAEVDVAGPANGEGGSANGNGVRQGSNGAGTAQDLFQVNSPNVA